MSYRPFDWGDYQKKAFATLGSRVIFEGTDIELFETGADAMYEALKKEGLHLTKEDMESGVEPITRVDPAVAGTWVFIPD